MCKYIHLYINHAMTIINVSLIFGQQRRNQQKNMRSSIHRPFLTVSIVVSNGIPGLFQLHIISSRPSFQQLDHSEPVPELFPQAHSQVSDVKRNTMNQYFREGIFLLIIKLDSSVLVSYKNKQEFQPEFFLALLACYNCVSYL